ncbi:MAG: hypothetical protein ABS938_10175 [Psychrobacillus psychrodurans]
MKLILATILVIIGIGLGSINFDDISSGWNTLLNFSGGTLFLIGLIIIGNRFNKKSL